MTLTWTEWLRRSRIRATSIRALLKRGIVLLVGCALLSVALGGCAISIGQSQTITPGNGITVPVQIIRADGGVRIDADLMINNRGPYTFVLDTGAESSVIDASLTTELGLKPDGPSHQVGGVGGSVDAIPVKIDSWNLSTLKLPSMDIDSASLADGLGSSEEGLLGADILSQFGTITINFTTSELTVYKQIA